MRRRRYGRHEHRRVVLHREDDGPQARLGAIAARSVIRELGIAEFWRVDVTGDEASGFLVSVDYRPAVHGQP